MRSSSSLTAIFKKCIARSTTTPCTDDAPVSSWSSPSVKETMSPCAKRWNGSSAPIANPRRSGAGAPASSDSAPDPPTRGFKTRITASRCNVPSRIPRRPNRAYPSRCNRARSHVSRRSFARSISSSSSRRSALANFSRCAVKPTRSVAREDPRWRVPFAPRDVPRGLPEEDEEAFAFGSASRRWEKPRGVEEDADADGSAAPNRAQILRRSSWALAGSLRAAGERRGPPRRSAKGDSPLVETRTATRLRMPAGRTPGAGGGGGGARDGLSSTPPSRSLGPVRSAASAGAAAASAGRAAAAPASSASSAARGARGHVQGRAFARRARRARSGARLGADRCQLLLPRRLRVGTRARATARGRPRNRRGRARRRSERPRRKRRHRSAPLGCGAAPECSNHDASSALQTTTGANAAIATPYSPPNTFSHSSATWRRLTVATMSVALLTVS